MVGDVALESDDWSAIILLLAQTGDVDDDESEAMISPTENVVKAVGERNLNSSELCVQRTLGILSVLGYERTATLTNAIDPTAAGGK